MSWICQKKGDLGSPPDIEVNISPKEKMSKGVAYINGSITHPKIKLLKKPLKLTITNGFITKIEGKNEKINILLNKLFGKKNQRKEC